MSNKINYTPHDWVHGEIIKEEYLDNIEQGLVDIVQYLENENSLEDYATKTYVDNAIGNIELISGEKGDKGDQGISIRFKGEWSSTVAYVNDSSYIDLVSYNGNTYICKVSNTNKSVSDTTYWNLVAKKGEQGIQGEKGDKGDKGEQGIQGLKGDKGDDGLTTSIEVNGQVYNHSNGRVTLPNLATESFVTSKINEAQLGGGSSNVDLSGYVTNEVLNDFTDGKKQRYLTKAEYDLLSEEEKQDSSIVWNITDDDGICGGGAVSASPKLLVDYTHTANKVIIPSSLDLATGIYTTQEPHGLNGDETLLLRFKDGNKFFETDVQKIPNELWTFSWRTWYMPKVVVVNDTQFKLKLNSNNNPITYSQASDINGRVECDGTWGFEVSHEDFTFTNEEFSKYSKLTFDIYAPNMCCSDNVKFDIFNKTLSNFDPCINKFPFIPESNTSPSADDLYKSLQYKNSYLKLSITLYDDYIKQELYRTTYGLTTKFRYMHEQLKKIHSDTILLNNYTPNVKFKNTISILSYQYKCLNGTKIKIYGEMKNDN